jgi:hypothetical protein
VIGSYSTDAPAEVDFNGATVSANLAEAVLTVADITGPFIVTGDN